MRAVELAAGAYLANSVVGTVIAIRGDKAATFAGIRMSTGSVARDFLYGPGTALSAPLVLLVTLVAAVGAGRSTGRIGRAACSIVTAMGVGFAVGQAGEPITWRSLASPRRDPVRTAVVAANLTIPIAMFLASRIEMRARVPVATSSERSEPDLRTNTLAP